jgi:hypothetical protein
MPSRTLASSLLAATVVLVLRSAPVGAEEACLKSAWGHLKASEYDAAIEAADLCIDNFALEAKRLEAGLKETPPLAPSNANKNKIFKQGILNDVAAAYVVKGKAAEAMALKSKSAPEKAAFKQTAIEAYEAASGYKHAWVWDPGPPEGHGWFWSPSQVASDRLTRLKHEDGPGHRP